MSSLADTRRAAFGAAYRMLGSVADAEDVAQEAMLRLHAAPTAPETPAAWVVRVATRLALDRLRSARARREAYVGPWLPEPLLDAPGPAEAAELADSVSLALLVVLETLSPAERAAFILHDVFGFDYGELSSMLERGPSACRQLVSRARRALREPRRRYEPDRERRERIAGAFLAAAGGGTVEDLVAVLAEDAVLRTDGGGVVSAARRPIEGAERVARALVALRGKGARHLSAGPVWVNGTPGAMFFDAGRPESVMGVDVDADGRVSAVHVLREPTKLAAALARLPELPTPVVDLDGAR